MLATSPLPPSCTHRAVYPLAHLGLRLQLVDLVVHLLQLVGEYGKDPLEVVVWRLDASLPLGPVEVLPGLLLGLQLLIGEGLELLLRVVVGGLGLVVLKEEEPYPGLRRAHKEVGLDGVVHPGDAVLEKVIELDQAVDSLLLNLQVGGGGGGGR